MKKTLALVLFLVLLLSGFIALFAVAMDDDPPVKSMEITVEDKTTKFLSSVVGLDIEKYVLVMPTPPPGFDNESWAEIGAKAETRRLDNLYPPEYCGLVKEEWGSLKFKAQENQISVMSNCLNEKLRILKIDNRDGNYIYTEQPTADLLDQAKIILQRYQVYLSQVEAVDGTYLFQMQEILNKISDLSPANVTVDNVNFQISQDEVGRIRIQWIYCEDNVTMSPKRVEFVFRFNRFESFWDGWKIYKVSELDSAAFEEAYRFALDAAQNCELRWVNDTVNQILSAPDLSDANYDVFFSMVLYRNDTFNPSSTLPRDPLTLYPYWRFTFYFNNGRVGCFSGVSVSLWGDTTEIISCDGYQTRNYPNYLE